MIFFAWSVAGVAAFEKLSHDNLDCRLPIADCRLPIADCRLPIVGEWIPQGKVLGYFDQELGVEITVGVTKVNRSP